MSSDRPPLLQSFATHARRAELGEHGIAELPPSAREHEPTVGHYDLVAGVPWALYRGTGGLTLRIDNAAFRVDGSLAFSLLGTAAERRLEITRAASPVAFFAAPAPETPLLEETLESTAFAEEEDFDFARFVVNVAADRARRVRIYDERE